VISDLYIGEQGGKQCYVEVFDHESIYKSRSKSFVYLRLKKTIARIEANPEMSAWKKQSLKHENGLFLISTVSPKHPAKTPVRLYLEMNSSTLDDQWNVAAEISRNLRFLNDRNIYFEFMPFDQLHIQASRVVIDALEFAEMEHTAIDKNMQQANIMRVKSMIDLKFASFVLPELFLGKQMNRRSNIWILGNVLYFMFEVGSIGQNATQLRFVRQISALLRVGSGCGTLFQPHNRPIRRQAAFEHAQSRLQKQMHFQRHQIRI
jgi:hypothetical protein